MDHGGVQDYALPLLAQVEEESAIHVEHLSAGYGKHIILDDLHIHVPKGSIYGLLGPSGCGKTTALKVLLGRIQPKRGRVRVFSHSPADISGRIPGPDVGYMPQELSIYPEMTIRELLRFHALLHDMDEVVFEDRLQWLLRFLDLPSHHRMVGSLSGGQQRRVSLCIALIHKPKLLLLDEPTVGVDPLLRKRIWEYLVTLSQEGVTTVITTHYIEEARQAHRVGLMRSGRILAEEHPEELIRQYRSRLPLTHTHTDTSNHSPSLVHRTAGTGRDEHVTLEEVFLHLCWQDDKAHGAEADGLEGSSKDVVPTAADAFSNTLSQRPDETEDTSKSSAWCNMSLPSRSKVWALAWKNLKRMQRNYAFLMFVFLLPSIQVILFCICIGADPKNLPIAGVNLDTGSFGTNFFSALTHGSDVVDLTILQTRDASMDYVRQGKGWASIYIPDQFTQDLKTRLTNSSAEIISGSTIFVNQDMSNQQISLILQQKMAAAFEAALSTFIQETAPQYNTTLVSPLRFDTPVYGEQTPKFTDFVAPGIIITIAFAQSIGLTAIAFVSEKTGGTLERSWAAGVRSSEMVLSQIFVQFLVILGQIGLMLMFALGAFQLRMIGNVAIVFVLAVGLGLTGAVDGLVISTLCQNEVQAVQFSLASFFPVMLLSGVIWPVEAIPPYLQWFSKILPTTWAAEAMRSIFSRGWGFDRFVVWSAFAITAAWFIALLALAIFNLKRKK